ncbi:MAG: carboxypeptidase regulatory-like domain-containing protein, partial [Clostridia bacterium]|nr:carboxypeptidase regulatory-like domain-containing protein [Clostridia bacterium]
SSCVFIGCDEKKVEVNSISFKETESITMIVGQEYEPNVSVLPSYADNRNYYFEIGSNPDVLKISNKKITAMKSGVCQLKVVSQDNDYLTDMISIKVLDEAVQLSAPQNLVFYDNAFSFDPVKNAESYTILVNGAEFNIGNSTKFSLTQYEQLSNLSAYNTLLDVKVKANGDGVVSLSSQYGDSFKQIKISSVENLKIKQNTLMFDKVLNVGSYSIKFSNEKETVLSMDIDSADFNGNVIEIGLAKYLPHLNSGEYYCEVLASSNNYEIKTTENVSASAPSVVKFDSLAKPSNISFNAYTLHWDKVLNAEYYSILDESGNIIKDNIETNSFDLTKLNLSSTSYSYKLVANTISDLNVLTGLNYSDVISFKILEKPVSSIQNKVISWGTVTDATAYQVVITNQQGDVVQNSVVANNSYSISQLPAGNYEYKVKSLGNGKNTLASLDSSSGNFKFLNSVLDFKIENKVVSWQSAESNLFNLTILDESNNEILNTNLTSTSYDVSSIILN